MNQFKKAKQKAIESGHQVENITDLQTAGLKPIQETPKPAIIEEVKPVETAPVKVETIEVPVIATPEPVYEEVTVEPEPVVPIQIPTPAPIPVPVRVAPAPVVQEVTYVAEPVVEPIAAPVSKPAAAKKSVPNIFAPKNEAKSMRKSLVLKPTSVKIAENYCAKNGGSFNELIQTLLDNFIEEYGL